SAAPKTDGAGSATVPTRVVLLSDGTNTQGRSLESAAQIARAANAPVSTIAYGTDSGSVTVQGQQVAVPSDPAAPEQLVADIGDQLATTTEHQEISAGVAGLALLAALGAAAMSLAWSPRLP